MQQQNIDVLIVGGGPTGTTLAIDLARRGVSVRVIEKNAKSFPGSRAKGLQPRTLEVLDDLGAIDATLAAGDDYPPLGIHVGPLTIPKRMFKKERPSDAIPYPNTWLIPQYQTDSILHQRAGELGVHIEYNSKLEGLSQTDTHVEALVQDASGTTAIGCKFLVGADGGASTVRETVGIDFTGKTDEADRMMLVDSEVEGLSRDYWHMWPGMGGRGTAACPLPHSKIFQWYIRLQPDEEPDFSEAALNRRVRGITKNQKLRLHAIQWTSIFRPNIRLAAHYSNGRVFIAGDAAHVHTPMGAQGLNTGVQDAYNLGWKLAQVVSGAPVALLETYEAERRPVAAIVLGMSTQTYEKLGKGSAESMKRGQDERQLLITYRNGPLAQFGADTTPTLVAGDRAPDAVLRDEKGGGVRLFEIYRGPEFTAVAFGDEAARDLSQFQWPDTGAQLKRVVINARGCGKQDIVLSDAGSFTKSYGVEDDTVFLIRPDGYIAQIARRDRVAALEKATVAVGPPRT